MKFFCLNVFFLFLTMNLNWIVFASAEEWPLNAMDIPNEIPRFRYHQETLNDIYMCSADLIESAYDVSMGKFDTITQGALYLQSVLKLMVKESRYSISDSHIEGQLQSIKVQCEKYLSASKQFSMSFISNSEVLEGVEKDLKINKKVHQEIIDLVHYAHYRNSYKEDKSGLVLCQSGWVKNHSLLTFRSYNQYYQCITPLNRVFDLKAKAHSISLMTSKKRKKELNKFYIRLDELFDSNLYDLKLVRINFNAGNIGNAIDRAYTKMIQKDRNEFY